MREYTIQMLGYTATAAEISSYVPGWAFDDIYWEGRVIVTVSSCYLALKMDTHLPNQKTTTGEEGIFEFNSLLARAPVIATVQRNVIAEETSVDSNQDIDVVEYGPTIPPPPPVYDFPAVFVSSATRDISETVSFESTHVTFTATVQQIGQTYSGQGTITILGILI